VDRTRLVPLGAAEHPPPAYDPSETDLDKRPAFVFGHLPRAQRRAGVSRQKGKGGRHGLPPSTR
jgi:hypothetical protein